MDIAMNMPLVYEFDGFCLPSRYQPRENEIKIHSSEPRSGFSSCKQSSGLLPVNNSFIAIISQYPDVYESVLLSDIEGSFKHEIPLLVYDFLWSPDGTQIVASDDENVYLIDPVTAAYRQILNLPLSILSWSPSGKQVLLASEGLGKPELMIYDIASDSIILRGIYVDDDFIYDDGMWGKLTGTEANNYSISGTVTKFGDNSLLAGVDVFLSGAWAAATNQKGEYYIANVPAGVHLVQPKSDFLNFIPPSIVMDLNENRSGINFVASEKKQEPVVYLEAIEVTQGLQNIYNSIPLMQNRPAVIRLYFGITEGSTEKFSADLLVTNSQNQQIRLSPENSSHITIDANHHSLDKRDSDIEQNLYYVLPAQWAKDQIKIEIVPTTHKIENCPRDCERKFLFSTKVAPMKFHVFQVSWSDTNRPKNKPSFEEISMSLAEIYVRYPLNIDGIQIESVRELQHSTNGRPDARDVWFDIGIQRALDGCLLGCSSIYLGVMVNPPEHSDKFLGFLPPSVGFGLNDVAVGYWFRTDYIDSNGTPIPPAMLNGVIPHEVAHVLGRHHTNYCGAWSLPGQSDHPNYPEGRIDKVSDQYSLHALRLDNFDLLPANLTFDLMTYCQNQWPSDHTYKKLIEEINKRFAAGNNIARRSGLFSLVQDRNSFSAVIAGKINNDIAEINQIYQLDSLPPAENSTGKYSIKIMDKDDKILSVTYFEPASHNSDQESYFIVVTPWDKSVSQIVISNGHKDLVKKIASQHVPEVMINSSLLQQKWEGDLAVIKWNGFDLDGDTLSYVVQLSYDGGETWRTEAVNLTETYLELPLQFIPGTNQALIRVLASDGFHTAQVVSDTTFTIASHNPYAYITTPSDGREYLNGHHIFLYGDGYDVEDGQLSDSAFSWRSSQDGILGQGKTLTIPASELQSGEHLITLLVTDSDGMSSEASITIFVKNPDGSLTTEPSKINSLQWWIYAGIATGLLALLSLVVGAGVWLSSISKSGKKVERKPSIRAKKNNVRETDNISLGIRLAKEKKYQESFEILRQAVQENPHHAEAWLFLGFDLANLGDSAGAKRCFERAKRLGASQANQALEWLEKRSAKNV
jgi:hypothetical protein